MLEDFQKVLVTGGAGFIGSHLAATILSLGKEVVVFDNLSTGLEDNLPQGAMLIMGDVRNPEQVAQATEGSDLIFHVAANANGTVSVNNPRLDFESNVCGTFNVLDAALQVGVKKFVYVSSASVYGIPQRLRRFCRKRPREIFCAGHRWLPNRGQLLPPSVGFPPT